MLSTGIGCSACGRPAYSSTAARIELLVIGASGSMTGEDGNGTGAPASTARLFRRRSLVGDTGSSVRLEPGSSSAGGESGGMDWDRLAASSQPRPLHGGGTHSKTDAVASSAQLARASGPAPSAAVTARAMGGAALESRVDDAWNVGA